MKDKLYKTGHKKAYYKARNFGIILGVFIAFVSLASTPIIIASQNNDIKLAEDETVSSETYIEESSESSEFNLPF